MNSPDRVLPLSEVARRVVVDCLGLREHENFLLVTDDAVAREIADAIIDVARDLGADPVHARIATRRTSGEEPPPTVAGAMIAADVCLCVASRSIYHTRATGEAKAAGTRGLFNGPSRLDTWTHGAMTAAFPARPTSGSSGSASTRQLASPTTSPSRRRQPAPFTSHSATARAATAGPWSARCTSTAWSSRQPSRSMARSWCGTVRCCCDRERLTRARPARLRRGLRQAATA